MQDALDRPHDSGPDLDGPSGWQPSEAEPLPPRDTHIVPANIEHVYNSIRGMPSYSEMEAIVCGLIGETTVTKRREVTAEMLHEFVGQGGRVVKEGGRFYVLCDRAAVITFYGGS